MQLGFGIPVSGSWATPDRWVEVAQRAEELGYASLWGFQRLLSPLDADDRPRLEPQYRSVQDPVVLLAHVAAVTSRVRLGLAIVNAPYYSPTLLAKMLTTLDHASGGRLDAGLGIGWSPDEFAAVGVPIERRGARAEEFLTALEQLWTAPVVDHRGAFYEVPRASVEPKPVQSPYPPILLGGTAEPALRRAGRRAAGWISSSRADLRAIGASIETVRAAATEAGRDPSALRFVCRGVVKVRSGERAPLTGSYDEIRRDLADLAEQGVTETFVDLNFDPQIGSPDADPDESMRRAREVLEALAPQ